MSAKVTNRAASEAASAMASKRWAGVDAAGRSEHMTKMAAARWEGVSPEKRAAAMKKLLAARRKKKAELAIASKAKKPRRRPTA